jgi:hypothetical protein
MALYSGTGKTYMNLILNTICLLNGHVDNLGLTAGNFILLTGKTHD